MLIHYNINIIKMKYICERCKKPFYTKGELESHEKKKKKCPIQEVSEIKLPICECDCGSILSSPHRLNEHKIICSYIKKQNRIKSNMEINNSNIKNNKGIIANGDNKIFANNNITINNKYSTIIILPYTEKFQITAGLTQEEQEKITNPNRNPYLTLFELVHCNPQKPSYHNIYYQKEKVNRISVFTGIDWEEKKTSEIIAEIIQIHGKDLSKFLSHGAYLLPKKTKDMIHEHIKLIDTYNVKTKLDKKKFDNNMTYLHTNIISILVEKSNIICLTYIKSHSELNISGSEMDSMSSSESVEFKKKPKKHLKYKSNDDDSLSEKHKKDRK